MALSREMALPADAAAQLRAYNISRLRGLGDSSRLIAEAAAATAAANAAAADGFEKKARDAGIVTTIHEGEHRLESGVTFGDSSRLAVQAHPDTIPFWLQGDPSLHSDRVLRKRMALRHSHAVEKPLLAWWEAAMHSLAAKPHVCTGLLEYVRLNEAGSVIMGSEGGGSASSSPRKSKQQHHQHQHQQAIAHVQHGITEEGYLKIFRKVYRCSECYRLQTCTPLAASSHFSRLLVEPETAVCN